MMAAPPPLGLLPSIPIGHSHLPTYWVVLSLMTLGLVLWINHRSKKMQFSGSTAFDLFFVALFSGIFGARLFHVFYEEPLFYQQNPWAVFEFWNGGFVYYGGLIFGWLGGWVALFFKKQSFARWLDFFTPILSLGTLGGRGACFLTGCCYGKVCDLPWSYASRHPTQLYAMVVEGLLLWGLLRLEKTKWISQRPSSLFCLWLGLHSSGRFLIEFFRDDPRGPAFGPLSVAMVLSLVFIVLSLVQLQRLKTS